VAVRSISGGAKLQAKLRELSAKVSRAAAVEVGFLAGSTETDRTSLPMVAAIQEFGAPGAGIPPRPYFRPMIAAKSPRWGETLGNLLVADGYDAAVSLDKMGQGIKGQLQKSIEQVTSPALSPVTLLLRERFGNNPGDITFSDVRRARQDIASGRVANVTPTQTKPLVWTGHMLNSVDYEVKS
jgi:hypothetical protein